jgi:predicted phosphodiesterase
MGIEEMKQKREDGYTLKKTKQDAAFLRTELERTLEQLETLRVKKRLRIPERTKRSASQYFIRAFIADTHGSHVDKDAFSAMISDLDGLNVKQSVLLGDIAECGGFLSNHHALGYVAQFDEIDYEADMADTTNIIDLIQGTSEDVIYIEGNHEHRVERWCVEMSMGHKGNANFLYRRVSPEHVLNLKERGIRYIRQGEHYDNLPVRGTIKLGNIYCTHGFSTSEHAAKKTVLRFAGNVIYGHTHRADDELKPFVNVGLVKAHCPGCLCVLSPRWRHTDPSNWTHGYTIHVVCESTGEFQQIHVPIYNGRSYMSAFVDALRQ